MVTTWRFVAVVLALLSVHDVLDATPCCVDVVE
jgi:hypothetical protein